MGLGLILDLVIYIYVACDGEPDEGHRIRRASTPEYHHMIGTDRSRILTGKLNHSRPNQRRIISQTPSFKASSTRTLITAISYVFKNYNAITKYYDEDQLFNKIKFSKYVKKQKVISEICLRLLSGSRKYGSNPKDARSQSDISPSFSLKNKHKPLPPVDDDNERDKTIVIAFGAAEFGNLRGNVLAPNKVIKEALNHFLKERNRKIPTYMDIVDEYLTSQICSKCQTRTLENMENSLSKIHADLQCSACKTIYNRDEMAAINIRSVFLYLSQHNDKCPPTSINF